MKNYEQLYKEALFHLRCVSGSRNSFTPEMHEAMFAAGVKQMRQPGVEEMHQDAVRFLQVYDRVDAPLPAPQVDALADLRPHEGVSTEFVCGYYQCKTDAQCALDPIVPKG